MEALPSLTELVGLFASCLSVVSLLPQVWRTWQTRRAGDLSYGWLAMSLLAASSWTLYGVLLPAAAVIWANSICTVIILTLLGLKIWLDRQVHDSTRARSGSPV